jgi:hypothetical protein
MEMMEGTATVMMARMAMMVVIAGKIMKAMAVMVMTVIEMAAEGMLACK